MITIAIVISLFCLGMGVVAGSWFLSLQLTLASNRPRLSRWLLFWLIKGLALPLLCWGIMNLGLSWNLQPFMPQVQAAQNRGGPWAAEFFEVAASGLFIISTYWSAATLTWVLSLTAQEMRSESRKDLWSLCWTCLLATSLPALLLVLLGGWTTLGLAATLLLAPVAGYLPKLIDPQKLPPQYARAIARAKFGKYADAEREIIRQLENHEEDFDGWMMLADLYANHFNDLAEAQCTILEICDQPQLTPTQLSLALHRLADWHLTIAQDPDAARRALLVICDRLPGSHLAHMARLRINQLPRTQAELRQRFNPARIPLPTSVPAVPTADRPSATNGDPV